MSFRSTCSEQWRANFQKQILPKYRCHRSIENLALFNQPNKNKGPCQYSCTYCHYNNRPIFLICSFGTVGSEAANMTLTMTGMIKAGTVPLPRINKTNWEASSKMPVWKLFLLWRIDKDAEQTFREWCLYNWCCIDITVWITLVSILLLRKLN